MFNIWNKLTGPFGKEDKDKNKIQDIYDPEVGIDELLYLPTRVLNALERNGIYTIKDLENTGKDS